MEGSDETGNYNIITAAQMARMKDEAIVGNIGHFDNEIDMAVEMAMRPRTNVMSPPDPR